MNDVLANDGPAPPLRLRLRLPANRVSSKAILWWTLQAVIGWGVVLLGLVAGLVVMNLTGTAVPWWAFAGGVVVIVVALTDTLVIPRLRYHVHRWETTDQAVYVQQGWLNREWRIAPLSRVQTVDTQRGPLQQWLGLSTVTVTTASAAGPLKILGLDRDEAASLVDELTAITQATPGDAT